jgi:hypothetical protein
MKRKYKLEIEVDADDNVTHVSRVQVQTPLDVSNKVDGISEVTPKQGWRPVDKREFTYRVLNNVDRFVAK